MTPEIARFYRFTPLPDPAAAQALLLAAGDGVTGTVLLATEGINGTVAGHADALDRFLAAVRSLPGCADLAPRRSPGIARAFGRLKVKVKREVVTMGAPLDPALPTGTKVAPGDWNALIAAPDVALIDTRNGFEVAMGSFPGAIDPATRAFGDFPGWWAANAPALAGKRIAMFCTGGIRCEKASRWLLAQGVPEVLQLEGGILTYLETVPEGENRWQGACFVFDGRESVV
jgi:UPF0176 protein